MTAGQFHIDILAARSVRNSRRFDVVMGGNLFGNIVSDMEFAMGQAKSDRYLSPVRSHP